MTKAEMLKTQHLCCCAVGHQAKLKVTLVTEVINLNSSAVELRVPPSLALSLHRVFLEPQTQRTHEDLTRFTHITETPTHVY